MASFDEILGSIQAESGEFLSYKKRNSFVTWASQDSSFIFVGILQRVQRL